jgi:hypothetical protein
VDPLQLIQEAKKTRKRKRKTANKDGDQNEEDRANNEDEDVSTGMHRNTEENVAPPRRISNLAEYTGSQPCKLSSLKSEIIVSMEEALHCLFLAIVSVHVEVLAQR